METGLANHVTACSHCSRSPFGCELPRDLFMLLLNKLPSDFSLSCVAIRSLHISAACVQMRIQKTTICSGKEDRQTKQRWKSSMSEVLTTRRSQAFVFAKHLKPELHGQIRKDTAFQEQAECDLISVSWPFSYLFPCNNYRPRCLPRQVFSYLKFNFLDHKYQNESLAQ